MAKKSLLLSVLLLWVPFWAAATPVESAPQVVSRTTKAIKYPQKGVVKVAFHATELMPSASGEAKVQSRSGRTEVEFKLTGLDAPTKFSMEYLTYVLWAVSPQGRTANLGELILKDGA